MNSVRTTCAGDIGVEHDGLLFYHKEALPPAALRVFIPRRTHAPTRAHPPVHAHVRRLNQPVLRSPGLRIEAPPSFPHSAVFLTSESVARRNAARNSPHTRRTRARLDRAPRPLTAPRRAGTSGGQRKSVKRFPLNVLNVPPGPPDSQRRRRGAPNFRFFESRVTVTFLSRQRRTCRH